MRKKLIAMLIVGCILLAAAAGFLIYMESKAAAQPGSATEPETSSGMTTEPTEMATESTEETVGISLPTEDPADVELEDTLDKEDTPTQENTNPPGTFNENDTTTDTEGFDNNVLPEDEF